MEGKECSSDLTSIYLAIMTLQDISTGQTGWEFEILRTVSRPFASGCNTTLPPMRLSMVVSLELSAKVFLVRSSVLASHPYSHSGLLK